MSLSLFGFTIYASMASIPSSSTIVVLYWVYIAANISFISIHDVSTALKFKVSVDQFTRNVPCRAKLLPTHILPPLPNAQNHLLIRVSSADDVGFVHRSGSQHSASGNTSWFLCKEYACALILVLAGTRYFSASTVAEGTTRGCPPGTGACSRSVSITTASRRERLSMAFGVGRSGLDSTAGYNMLGESETSSSRSCCWR